MLDVLGCPYNPSKSLVSDQMAEFAGKLITPERVISAFKWRDVSSNNFMDLMRTFGQRFKPMLRRRETNIYNRLCRLLPPHGCNHTWGPGSPLEQVISSNVHDALQQVQNIKTALIAGEKFTGYSGRTRAVAGISALAGAIVMSHPEFPLTITAHLIGWGAVMFVAFCANYFALFHWFLSAPDTRRDWRRLVPAAEGLPPIFVGGILSLVLIQHNLFDSLFGMWMCLFGLTNLSSRRVLPRGSWALSIFYIACGAGCLILPISFLNPWPMGIVFFVGELLGGYIFHIHRLPEWRLRK